MLFFVIYLFILERGKRKEKERERNINVWLPLVCPQLGTWPATQACALTGNQTGDLLVRRPVLNPLSYTSQGMYGLSIPCIPSENLGAKVIASLNKSHERNNVYTVDFYSKCVIIV